MECYHGMADSFPPHIMLPVLSLDGIGENSVVVFNIFTVLGIELTNTR